MRVSASCSRVRASIEADVAVSAERERLAVRAVRELLSTPAGCPTGSPICSYVRASKKKHPADDGGDRERLPVGTDGDPPEDAGVAAAVHDPDRRRRAQEVGEQVAAGLRRVVDRDRLAGEQEREVEVLLDERLRAEALGELGGLRVARLAALDDGEDPARDGRREQDRDPGEQRAQAPVGAPDASWSPARRPRGSR